MCGVRLRPSRNAKEKTEATAGLVYPENPPSEADSYAARYTAMLSGRAARLPASPSPRPLIEKLNDIQDRSPKDYAALVVMVDFVLARLDAAKVLYQTF